MNKLYLTVAVLAGIAIGAIAVHGVHAQAGKKAYIVSEYSNVVDTATNRPTIAAAGGRTLYTVNGKVTALIGEAPKHAGILEWDSVDAAMKWAKDAPKADRRYVVEVEK